MAKSYPKAKGRSGKEAAFLGLPHSVLDSSDFGQLSGNAVKVLLSIARQYNGHNNGDLSAPGSKAKPNGIGSENTWYKAIKELIAADLIRPCAQPPKSSRLVHALRYYMAQHRRMRRKAGR